MTPEAVSGRGLAWRFQPAIATFREVFVTPDFSAKHPFIAHAVRRSVELGPGPFPGTPVRQNQWKLLPDFATFSMRKIQLKDARCVALATKSELKEARWRDFEHVFTGPDFF